MSKNRTAIITVEGGTVIDLFIVEDGKRVKLDFDYLIVDFDMVEYSGEYEDQTNFVLAKIMPGTTMEDLR